MSTNRQVVTGPIAVLALVLFVHGCSSEAEKTGKPQPASPEAPEPEKAEKPPSASPEAPEAQKPQLAPPEYPPGVDREITVDLGDGMKMEFVLIPPGEFMMGDAGGEEAKGIPFRTFVQLAPLVRRNSKTEEWAIPTKHRENAQQLWARIVSGDVQPGQVRATEQKPVHKVTITKAFYLGKYEVTQEQWEAMMDGNPSLFKDPKNPVESVRWDDCQAFLSKLNEKLGEGGVTFSLPTEAQWEYACRAGTTSGSMTDLFTQPVMQPTRTKGALGVKKGVRSLLPERPVWCFAQKAPDPFS